MSRSECVSMQKYWKSFDASFSSIVKKLIFWDMKISFLIHETFLTNHS